MENFLSGATALAYLMIGLFFLKYWRKTADRLFLCFAIAFWILTLQRISLLLFPVHGEDTTLVYAVRLLAFLVILFAIWSKNRTKAE